MKTTSLLVALAFAATLAPAAHAHRSWLLPSATVLSGNEPWVAVDAAVSNDLFYFEHNPLRLDGLAITAPDGSAGKAENLAGGRYRNSFDLKLSQAGTWRIANVADFMFASYKLGGETKRIRGTAESIAKELPPQAELQQVSQQSSRVETFVTLGKPSTGALAPTGRGLELQPLTHPNELVAGESAVFRFLIDGRPAAGAQVNLVPGGIRWRNQLNDQQFTADANGEVRVRWTAPGYYWINASVGADARSASGGTLAQPLRRASYSATLEVLPP